MSFGFSVSDIFTLSETAYKIYGILKTGRKKAPSSFAELSDAVFGLRCALEHLSRQANEISLNNVLGGQTNNMHEHLHVMIKSCTNTLDGLQRILNKYVGRVQEAVPTNVPSEPRKIGRGEAFKEKVAVNWDKVKWAVEEKGLAEIRIKILSHTSAINLILDMFLWFSMRQIQGSSDKISDKTDVILQMVNGNKGSPQLIREIHQMLLQAQVKPSPSAGVSIAKRTLETGPKANGSQGGSIGITNDKDIQARISKVNEERALASHLMFSRLVVPNSPCQQTLPFRGPKSVAFYHATPQPPESSTSITSRPLETRSLHSTDQQASHSTPPTSFTSPALWVSIFDSTLSSWASSKDRSREAKRTQQRHVIDELRSLNTYIGTIADKPSRREFRRQLDDKNALTGVFEKARSLLGGSVMLEKQITVYQNDKEADER